MGEGNCPERLKQRGDVTDAGTAQMQNPAPRRIFKTQGNVLGFCLGVNASLTPLTPNWAKIVSSLKTRAGRARTEKPNRNTTAQFSPA